MPQCQICSKTRTWGKNVSHSKRHTSRTYQPNVQRARIQMGGKFVQVSICTRCLRNQDRSV
jgi:large subunit ribosomal protein L28